MIGPRLGGLANYIAWLAAGPSVSLTRSVVLRPTEFVSEPSTPVNNELIFQDQKVLAPSQGEP